MGIIVENLGIILIVVWLIIISSLVIKNGLAMVALPMMLDDFSKKMIPTIVAGSDVSETTDEEMKKEVAADLMDSMHDEIVDLVGEDQAAAMMELAEKAGMTLSDKRSAASAKGLDARKKKKIEQMFADSMKEMAIQKNPIAHLIMEQLPIIGPFLEENPEWAGIIADVGRPLVKENLPRIINLMPQRVQDTLNSILDSVMKPKNKSSDDHRTEYSGVAKDGATDLLERLFEYGENLPF